MFRSLVTVLFFSLLSLLVFTSLAQDNPWKKLQSPVNSTLRQLMFVDSLNGWAAGADGIIIGTTDAGASWVIQNSTVNTFITDIFFTNKNIGWAITIMDTFPFSTLILKTNNGGNEWTVENFQSDNALMRTIFFFDSLNGFIGGSYIAHTSDGGTSWTRAEVDSSMVSNFPVYGFNFYNRQFGYACGGRIDIAGVVWRTTNYGLNWSAEGISADEIFDIYILDSLRAISLSGDPEGLYPIAELKTINAGMTWSNDTLSFFGLSFAIDFRTYNEGWSASGYKFLITTDRAETWSEFETPDRSVIYDLQFTDARTGYAVGQDGVILKLKSPFEPSDVEDKEHSPESFALYQNYPNPFNPSTSIRFRISDYEFVSLKVYDILGNNVATLINENKSAGEYEIDFNPSASIKNPASGIYFYRLSVRSSELFQQGESEETYIQTKKMIYLK